MSTCKLIAYYRVSTAKQGRSGLGMEAQVVAVERYATASGCVVVQSFTEVETGKRSDRPELQKALAQARRTGATLLVAKLDRLARNTRFLLTLIESGADVAFGDLPNVPTGAIGKFLLTQMAAVAELEAGLISERTKAALAAYKARGGVLGTNNLTESGRAKGNVTAAAANRSKAVDAYADLVPQIAKWKADGLTLAGIAEKLNADGHTTRTGARWSPVQVLRLLKRV